MVCKQSVLILKIAYGFNKPITYICYLFLFKNNKVITIIAPSLLTPP